MSTLSRTQLTPVDPVLTEHAQRYAPTGLVCDQVFPVLSKIGVENGQIEVWDKSNMLLVDDTQRAIGGEASRARDPEPSYVAYKTKTHARKILLTPREMELYAASGGDSDRLRMMKTRKVVDQLMSKKEYDLAVKLTTSGNYETNYSTSLTNTWDGNSADIIGDVLTAKNKLGDGNIFANSIVLDQSVWNYVSRDSSVLDYMKYTKGGAVVPEDFEAVLGLRPIIAKSRYYTGSAWTKTWGDNAIVCFINPDLNPADAESDVSFGRSIMSEDFSVVEFEAPELDHRGATWIEAQHAYSHEFIAMDNTTDKDSVAGYLIANCLA